MPREVAWKLVVDETGAVKRMEIFDKAAEKTDKTVDKTKRTTDEASRSIKHMGGAFGSLRSVMGAAMGGLGLAGFGYGLESVISKTSELSKETETFSNLSGMSAKNSLYYVAALKARGISSEAFAKSLGHLARTFQTAERQQYSYAVGQAKAHAQGKMFTSLIGVQAEAFQTLGLNVHQLQAMAPEERMEKIIEAFTNLKNPVVKDREEMLLFGKGGTMMANVLVAGALGMKHQRQEAERFFPALKGGKNVMSELIAKQAEGKMAWEGLEFTLGTEVAPAFTQVIGAFSGLIAELDKGKGPLAGVESLFKGIAQAVESAGEALGLISPKKHKHAKHGSTKHDVKHRHKTGGGSGGGFGSDLEVALGIGSGVGAYKLVRHPFSTIKGIFGGARGIFGGGASALRALGRFAFPAEGDAAAGLFGSELFGGAAGLSALSAGASILPLSTAGYRGFASLIHPGFFASGEEQLLEALTGSTHPLHPMAYGNTELKGTPASKTAAGNAFRQSIVERDREIETWARLHHESLQRADNQYRQGVIQVALNVDGRKVAEAFVKNPNSQRYLAEAAEKAALARNARR